jgi:hypothetical protein
MAERLIIMNWKECGREEEDQEKGKGKAIPLQAWTGP